jgi:transaldolase
MKFFVDTAEIKDIKELAATGLLDGVTTNPTLIAKSGRKILEVIAEICEIVPGPVSAEVAGTEYEQILREAKVLRRIASNVTIKVPLTPDGLRACKYLSSDGAMVNVTLCFTAAQALLAAKAGATFISPFVGRLDDIGHDGLLLIDQIVRIMDNYDYPAEVLVASIRSPLHLLHAAEAGAHVATLPPAVIKQILQHPLTDAGLEKFLADWHQTKQKI